MISKIRDKIIYTISKRRNQLALILISNIFTIAGGVLSLIHLPIAISLIVFGVSVELIIIDRTIKDLNKAIERIEMISKNVGRY